MRKSAETILLRLSVTNSDALREFVRGALACRRQAIVYNCALMSSQYLSNVSSSSAPSGIEGQDGWARIESLSQLRALVGGRFQNLKDRWVKAGFPLREHRGDRTGEKNIDYAGWVELSTWIHKQGFEVRLAEEKEDWLFELKK